MTVSTVRRTVRRWLAWWLDDESSGPGGWPLRTLVPACVAAILANVIAWTLFVRWMANR